MLVHVRNLWES